MRFANSANGYIYQIYIRRLPFASQFASGFFDEIKGRKSPSESRTARDASLKKRPIFTIYNHYIQFISWMEF